MRVMDSSASSSPDLEIYLLGQFFVSLRGRNLSDGAVKGRKARSLLKLVALRRHGQIVRDRVTEALWPDLDATAATSQLYKALHHIRTAFAAEVDGADEWIEMTDDLVRLTPPGDVVIDIHRFEGKAQSGLREHRVPDLETAVSLYVGDLLPMDLYADWASMPREHYRQLYIDVLTTLATQYEQRGQLSEATQMLRLALEKNPALEAAHRALMRIFARRGQPTRALQQYDRCREVLHRELAMGPSLETKKTLDDVRNRRLGEADEPGLLQSTTPRPTRPIVGRDAECRAIERRLERLSNGGGGELLIRGGVGLGKTRLLQELAMRARRRGLRIFSGDAREEDHRIAYGPFVELFDDVLREDPSVGELLPEQLGQLVPSFSGDGIPVPHADRRAAQGYLFAQVQRVLAEVAEDGPIVVAIEDVHAADEGSRELFAYLARHGGALPLLLVATTRDEGDDLASLAGEEEGLRGTVLDLDPLQEEDHARLLRQHAESSVSQETVNRIFRRSEGNPLFALELLRSESRAGGRSGSKMRDGLDSEELAEASAPVPRSLRSVIEQQLDALSPEARHVLYIAAVIGRNVPYDVLAAVWSGAAEDEGIFDPLEELVDARLLDERGLDYSFRHMLVRDCIYASISEARRRTLHDLTARQLVATEDGDEEEPVEEIAHHFLRADKGREGIHYLLRAGERAEAAYAHDDALQRYGEALDALGAFDENWARRLRCDVFERVGDVYRACGRLEQSYDAYEDAVALADEVPLSTADRVELHRKIAIVAIFRTEIDRCQEHLDRGFDLLEEDGRARIRLLITQALHLWHQNRLEEAYESAREALDRAEAIDAAIEASQAREILAMTCLPLGRWEEGLEYERERQVRDWSPEIVVATDAHLCLWEYHVTGDQPFEQARSFMKRVAEQADELGNLRCVAVCHYALGTMHLWRGQTEAAIDELDSSLELHEEVGSPAGMAYVRARQGMLHTMEGALERGWRAVQDGIDKAERAAVRDHCLQRLYGIGLWNRLDAGDESQADALVQRSEDLLDETGACGACALELYPWLAYVHLQSGKMDRVEECGTAVSTIAENTGNPIGEATAAMIEASVLAAGQNEQQAAQRRREAFERVETAVTDATHSPITHYLDRMVDQQEELTA